MPIFFPDNDKRKTRLIEMATDTENFLYDASVCYTQFKALCAEVNSQVADVYKEAGLGKPTVTNIDVIKAADPASNVNTDETIVSIVEVIVDVAGFATTIKYLAPAATKGLVSIGAMSAETAAKVLTKFTVPIIDREVEITAGDLAGSLLGGILGGIAVAGIDLAIDAIEGSLAKDKLRDGLHHIYPMRLLTKIALEQSRELYNSINSVKTTLDAIAGAGIPLTEALIKNLITKDVTPSVNKAKAITAATVTVQLNLLDNDRKSWTVEDLH